MGSDSRLWIESSTDRTWRAGDQFFFRISRQILPRLSEIGAECTYVGVIDLGVEHHFGRGHGVVVRDENFGSELAVRVAGA